MHLITARVEMLISYFSLLSVNSTVFPSSWADLLLVAPHSKCVKKPQFSPGVTTVFCRARFVAAAVLNVLQVSKVKGHLRQSLFGGRDAETQQRFCVGEHVHSHTRSRWHQRAHQIRTEHFLYLPPVQEKKKTLLVFVLYIRFKMTSIYAIET